MTCAAKVSPDSPISNVEEKDKAIGDTTATVLGEFIGTEGYDVEPLTVFEQSFGQKDLGPLLMRGIVPTFKKTKLAKSASVVDRSPERMARSNQRCFRPLLLPRER